METKMFNEEWRYKENENVLEGKPFGHFYV